MSNSRNLPPFRQARLPDGPFIYRMLREFYRRQGGIYGIPLDPDSAGDTIAEVIGSGVCLVGLHSCAGAIIAPFPFNRSAIIAQVLFWSFQTPREITIFKALAGACKLAGATHISAAGHFPDNRIVRYYEKIGLHRVETQCISRL